MTKLIKQDINLFAAIITIVGLLTLTSISCKAPTVPEANAARITITNNYGETIDIYGDGSLQGSTADQLTSTLERVPYGEHLLEATKSGETDVIASITLDITENIQYTWTVTK